MKSMQKYYSIQDTTDEMDEHSSLANLPMKLSWKNLSYTVTLKHSRKEAKKLGLDNRTYQKRILYDESGFVQSGEAMFIMGASGAGKTTMLNALCDRLVTNRKCKLGGQIMVNDTLPIDQKHFGKYGAYVMQDDILFQTFTCEEWLTFAARLRLGIPEEQIKVRVDEVLNQLGLQHCRDTYVGSPILRGMSGGEKKRTAIAVELVTNPSIIFLDEPTSGLDSFNAERIVRLLNAQAKLGKTVIATIHQPNSETFLSFDRLLLLMEGHTIYQGPAKDSVEYFKKLGYPCPRYSNPADFFLREFSTPKIHDLLYDEKVEKVTIGYTKQIDSIIQEENEKWKLPEIDISWLKGDFRTITWGLEFKLLLRRTFLDIYRNPMYMGARISQTIFSAMLALIIFWDLGYDRQGIENKIKVIFFIIIDQTMCTMFPVLMTFLNEREVFIREYANHTYGVISYYLAKTLVELPFLALMTVLYTSITYFGLGLEREFETFLWFLTILIIIVLCAGSFGLVIGTAFTNPVAAVQMGPLWLSPLILLSGVLSNLDNISVVIAWMQYISPIRYGAEALLRNEFDGNKRYPFNPVEALNYNIGFYECLLYIIIIAIVLRILALIAIKLRVSKAQ